LAARREVSQDQGQALAESWGCAFVECSAKFNENIELLFQRLLDEVDKAAEPEPTYSSTRQIAGDCADWLCCRAGDTEMLSDTQKVEQWAKWTIIIVLVLGILSVCTAILTSLLLPPSDEDRIQVVTALFAVGAALSLVSGMGLFGICQNSEDFLRLYSYALVIVAIVQIVIWVVMYRTVPLLHDYAGSSFLVLAIGLVIELLSTTLVCCYQRHHISSIDDSPQPYQYGSYQMQSEW
jgi:hypothetical protein